MSYEMIVPLVFIAAFVFVLFLLFAVDIVGKRADALIDELFEERACRCGADDPTCDDCFREIGCGD